jgi:mRNA-degrading endonuclease RelE of RelBE toxin-antitoxin system
MFTIYITDQAKQQLNKLKTDQGLNKRYKAVKKALCFLAENPRHKSLQTHEFTSLKGPKGEKVFEAYAEQATSTAYRIFWCYGPDKDQITILAVTKHPES